jgi:hypothetical protein
VAGPVLDRVGFVVVAQRVQRGRRAAIGRGDQPRIEGLFGNDGQRIRGGSQPVAAGYRSVDDAGEALGELAAQLLTCHPVDDQCG